MFKYYVRRTVQYARFSINNRNGQISNGFGIDERHKKPIGVTWFPTRHRTFEIYLLKIK